MFDALRVTVVPRKIEQDEVMVIEKIRKFLEEDPQFRITKEINKDTPLIETGVLDSFSVVKLMMFIEKEFSITVDVADLTEENVSTLGNIEKMVSFKLNKK